MGTQRLQDFLADTYTRARFQANKLDLTKGKVRLSETKQEIVVRLGRIAREARKAYGDLTGKFPEDKGGK